ncbi:MAG TPA: erythromycin esterase family protein [Longimicrobiaceae bacterium]|nr:erythromycin esterase family protein [Longimicrobiaceae bacterium]
MRILSLPLAAAAALALAGTARAQQPLNLGFEMESTARPGRPWGMTATSEPAMQATFALDSVVRREGRRSLRIDSPEGTASADMTIGLATPVAAGKTLRLTGWIRTRDVKGYAGLAAGEQVPGKEPVTDSMPERGATGTRDWTRFELSFRVDSAVEWAWIGVGLRGAGTAWFDGLELEMDGARVDAIPGPPPPTPGELAWLRRRAFPLATVDAGAPSGDLQPLRALVGDARVVALGESTHGTSEFFRAKHRLAEFLVREMGFNLFALEANQLQTERVNRYVLGLDGGDARTAIRGLFRVWQTEEVVALVDWMRAWNESGRGRVEFVGYDMQDPRLPMDSVHAFLSRVDPAYLAAADSAYASMRAAWAAEMYPQRPDSVLRGWREGAERVRAYLTAHRDAYLRRAEPAAVEWAVQNANVAYQSAVLRSPGAWRTRDSAMAVNLEWAMRQRPGSRAIVWAHNAHVARLEPWMGWHLARLHPADMRVIGLTTYEGRYAAALDYTRDARARQMAPVALFPGPPGSLEDALHRLGLPILVADLRGAGDDRAGRWLTLPRPARGIGWLADDYGFDPVNVARAYDAVLQVDRTTASRLLPEPPPR